MWNIVGDASLSLVVETAPQQYGWLDLSFTVDGNEPTESAVYTVIFPNGTEKIYNGIKITVYNCPIGEYQVYCKFQNETKNETVNVVENQGTKVTFDFSTMQTGTLHIYSNIDAIVIVSGPINATKTVDSSGWHLVGIPVGTYNLTAVHEDIIQQDVIVLGAGDEISYTFQFETYTIATDYFSLINDYLPVILICLAVILVAKW